MKIQKLITLLQKRRTLLVNEREKFLISAHSFKIIGLYSLEDNDLKKAHNLLCRISEIDMVLSLLEKN